MKLTLKYRGEDLKSAGSASNRVREKHFLRECFHKQLLHIWRNHNTLSGIDRGKLQEPILTNGIHDLPRPIRRVSMDPLGDVLFRFRLSGLWFIPLVTAPMETHCHVSVRIGRPMKSRSLIFDGGDLDGRLKVLFDALRMPHSDSELPQNASGDEEIFCLLSDDSLITGVSIESYELLSAHEPGYVDIDLDIRITAITPMWGTMDFLYGH